MFAVAHSTVYSISPAIRYVATYQSGALRLGQRSGLKNASDSESDRYEELFVNPAMLTLAVQRGGLDCGGLRYITVRYGHFFQVVFALNDGHLSVCIEPDADVIDIAERILEALRHTSI
jgi:hypothetical protein